MILAQASCGHFALFDPNEQLITQVCACLDPVYVAPGTAPVVHATQDVRRHTTSSRRPGRAIVGAVKVEVRSGSICPKCDGPMWNDAGIHGYRRTERGPVDCKDQPVEVAHG